MGSEFRGWFRQLITTPCLTGRNALRLFPRQSLISGLYSQPLLNGAMGMRIRWIAGLDGRLAELPAITVPKPISRLATRRSNRFTAGQLGQGPQSHRL